MRFSIIIPAYNAQATIRDCLAAVCASLEPDFEVLVVDDRSGDDTPAIVNEFPVRLIRLEQNKGPAHARNAGARQATGDILVFLDADVVIPANTLTRLKMDFDADRELVCVTALLSEDCPAQNFFSTYKNHYMHFIFSRMPAETDFLYGSLMAIRHDAFLPFDETFPQTDDTELGQRYKRLGHKILLDHELRVIHLKTYTFPAILKNDFKVPFWWTKTFCLHHGWRDIVAKRRFAHARLNQLSGIAAAYLTCLSLLMLPTWHGFLFGFVFLLAYYGFFLHLARKRGWVFLLSSVVFTFLDALVMGAGILSGLVFFLRPWVKSPPSYQKAGYAK